MAADYPRSEYPTDSQPRSFTRPAHGFCLSVAIVDYSTSWSWQPVHKESTMTERKDLRLRRSYNKLSRIKKARREGGGTA